MQPSKTVIVARTSPTMVSPLVPFAHVIILMLWYSNYEPMSHLMIVFVSALLLFILPSVFARSPLPIKQRLQTNCLCPHLYSHQSVVLPLFVSALCIHNERHKI